MYKIKLLKDSNTEILKKRVKNAREQMKPHQVGSGTHFRWFLEYVTDKHPELVNDPLDAQILYKFIESTWTGQAPKMFIVDHLEDFAASVLDKAKKESEDPAQTKIA